MKPKWNGHSVPARINWPNLFRPEWNGPFQSGRNEMAHSIPAGMKWSIPFRPEWNGPFHSGRNEMTHFNPSGMKWPIPIRPEWNDPFYSGRNESLHSGRNEMVTPWTQIRNMRPGGWLEKLEIRLNSASVAVEVEAEFGKNWASLNSASSANFPVGWTKPVYLIPVSIRISDSTKHHIQDTY